MRHFKQIIVVPKKVCNSFFNLPCIMGVEKKNSHLVYQLTDNVVSQDGRTILRAQPGDILAEDDAGRWWTLTEEEYQNYLQQTQKTI